MVGALGVAALLAGMAVGTSACGPCIHPCPSALPLERGSFTIVESPSRPELVGSLVEITDEKVELRFTDAEGHDWVVDYTIEEEY
ncbi:hypothetical protein [Nannocystis pusilla]|uniref:DUF4926 domain-containing protein n=1 Tax=Nannocystis pusilla TaxID=889268 RepID=A0ABS7TZX8_9BACT|nr:hypothetical protein [Nannocystis pusilla]MBZ5713835.1 hypothetical protein [Nannocystis pusilla]